MRRFRIRMFYFWVGTAVLTASGCKGGIICDDPDWCEDNKLMGCREPYDDDNAVWAAWAEETELDDCSKSHQTCVETHSEAACVWKSMPCKREPPYCENNKVHYCFDGYVSWVSDCEEMNAYCVDNPNPTGPDPERAVCAIEPGVCTPDEGERCIYSESVPGRWSTVTCKDFYWMTKSICPSPELCITRTQDGAQTAQCALSTTPCDVGVESFCWDPMTLARCSSGYPRIDHTCREACILVDSTHAVCDSLENTDTDTSQDGGL